MSEWYYARGGQQMGPVTFEQLETLSRTGGLAPADLVWTSTMKDWLPASQVAGLFQQVTIPSGVPTADPSNPYSAPVSTWNPVAKATAGESLEEIIHGSDPIDVGACVKRAIELAKRNAVPILLTGLIYFGITMGYGMISGVINALISGPPTIQSSGAYNSSPGSFAVILSILTNLSGQVLSIFLSLGTTRIALNLVSGQEAPLGLLFSGGSKLLRAIGASIIFGLMVFVGFVLLIVPGIYLALRYGQFLHAIVDRDLGVFESFSYSSSLTTNNRMNLFLLGLLCILIMLAGLLACGIGLIVAFPIVWMTSFVAYRWMQYGHRAALDHDGTTVPMLRKL